MASADILSETLTSITAIKLDELSSQRSTFESQKSSLLAQLNGEPNQRKKIEILLEKIENLAAMGKIDDNPLISLHNAGQFLEQSKRDPSVTDKLLNELQIKLEKELDVHSLKYEYASLYGRLVTEWLSASDAGDADSISSDGSSFEKVGRKEMHEQRITWENYVFKPLETDIEAIQAFLTKLFNSTKPITSAYKDLKKATELFEARMKSNKNHFDVESLKGVIEGLLRSDLVTNEKRKVLNDFVSSKTVLSEIADVLNMRMGALEKWHWDPRGTTVEQRRMLNGRYRFYHDEDLLQAILLRYIGLQWSVHFKSSLVAFQNSLDVWKSTSIPVSKADRQRRDYFLGPNHRTIGESVESHRKKYYKNDIFLEQLASKMREKRGGYDADSEDGDTRASGQQLTQAVLHTLVTEIIMKTRLGEDMTVVRTDFKWFGPSLPHSSMFAVLSFFGVSDTWVSFFRRALEAPMCFKNDSPDATVQTRKRGTPISGPLSDMLGETVLFCLDFAFNQQTHGRMYRLHDDIWFWGPDNFCEKGWSTMKNFATLMGLEFSEEKTGSIKITRNKDSKKSQTASSLPKGDVSWGLLKLGPDGRFVIDQDKLDTHVEELGRQLDGCKSVFEWVQSWNLYGDRYFTTNFGKPVQAYGKYHIDMILDAFSEIQAKVFTKTGGSVTTTLKRMISERFGVDDIPEGYLYFPTSLGGLDLKSPFVNLYLVRRAVIETPDTYMDIFFEREEQAYKAAKKVYDKGKVPGQSTVDHALASTLSGSDFMSFEEYTRYREHTSTELYAAYNAMMQAPGDLGPQVTSDVSAALVGDQSWYNLTPYQQWIIQLYGQSMISKFGGLNIVDKGLLPTGMVSMFRESRFKWQG